MRLRVFGLVLAGALAAPVRAEEFKCPEGAKDSGERPGIVVRWCEVTKDGRLLYHGPVWRWHRNGQLMAKENYVYGAMDGEIPSWWENGKQSSLGSFRGGKRIGRWKFWDEQGRIKFDVTYGDQGAAKDDYYPSGKKRASGTFNDGAKLGVWVYFNEDGTEKARCDFGEGLFALPKDPGCKMIADELDPKGFSRPVPRATVTPDGNAVIRIGPQTFAFTTPPEWTADATAGAEDGVPLVFFPKGTGWRKAGRNMYVRPLFKDGKGMKAVMESEKASFAGNVAEYKEAPLKTGKVSSGREYVAKTITYKPVMQTDSPFSIVQDNTIREAAAYLDASPEVVLLVVLACDEEQQMKTSLPNLTALVESARVPSAPATR
jgi:hypothetical protein